MRRRRAAIAVVAVGAAAAGAGVALTRGDDGNAGAASGGPTTTAEITRENLVDREDVSGTLGFASTRSVVGTAQGTLTRMAEEGATVPRGRSLYSVDGSATAFVMFGSTPAYRALDPGVDDGDDVLQLERNLRRLGYDPYNAMELDRDWDSATTAAVERWEEDRGVTEDGKIGRGEIVFSDGPVRVGAHKVEVGENVGPGKAVLDIASRQRIVSVDLPASRQALVRRGARVEVELPDGNVVPGEIRRVAAVADAPQEQGGEPTIEVEVGIKSRKSVAALDEAPVIVRIARERRTNVLTVPVTALLALEGGRYAIEVPDGGGATKLLAVETGLFGDGRVEIAGDGVREGLQVVVPE